MQIRGSRPAGLLLLLTGAPGWFAGRGGGDRVGQQQPERGIASRRIADVLGTRTPHVTCVAQRIDGRPVTSSPPKTAGCVLLHEARACWRHPKAVTRPN